MAFRVVDRQPGGNSGQISIGNAGQAVEIWTVIADNYNYTTEDIRNSGLFPGVYTTYHAQNPRLRLMPIEIAQDAENPSLFICTVTWTSDKLDPTKEQDDRNVDNPLDRVAKITCETAFEKAVSHRDFYGKQKTNAAGDLFDPPIEHNQTYLVVKIRKNVVVFPDWAFEYADSVNSMAFSIKGRTFDKGCAWLAYVKLGEIQYDGSEPYSEAQIELWVKKRRKPGTNESAGQVPDPWKTEQLNEGLYQWLDGNKDRRVRCTINDKSGVDGSGNPVVVKVDAVSPVPLKLNGGQLDPVNIDNATYIVFQDHEELDFNNLSYLWSDA
jgi:hypothetical protein